MQHTETAMSALDCPLGVFLRKYEVGRGEPCSVTGMGAVKGRWMIRDENYPEFLQLLHQYLFVDRRRPNNLVEQRRPDGLSPLLIDLDFKYSSSSAIERRFTMNHIKAFIRTYVTALTEFFDLPRQGISSARFFISLRPSPYEDKRKEGTSV
jgi:hypothetical protein